MDADIKFEFEPDVSRAEAIDLRMQRELGRSLAYIRERCLGVLPFDDPSLLRVIERLNDGKPVAPSVFAAYYELVMAISDDDEASARAKLDEIASATEVADGIETVILGDPCLGANNDRFIEMMSGDAGDDPDLEIGFTTPAKDVAEAFRGRLTEGFSLLDQAVPDLGGEIRKIIRLVVIAGSDLTKKMQFDGGSHFQLWGALFLNANFHPDRIAVAEVLAHETAHSLLFGFCTDEALVENDDDELFSSPLRLDPRPMDGIYHATFVSARMYWAMTRLAESPLLTSSEKERAIAAADTDMKNFYSGYGVVDAHGQLTRTGARLMASAKAYMDSQRAA